MLFVESNFSLHSIRVDSLGAALELMDSIKQKISEVSERLDKFIKEPKDIKGYTLANPAILRDVKVRDICVYVFGDLFYL